MVCEKWTLTGYGVFKTLIRQFTFGDRQKPGKSPIKNDLSPYRVTHKKWANVLFVYLCTYVNKGCDGVQCYYTRSTVPSLFSITANCRFKFISTKQDVRIPAIIYTELSFYDAVERSVNAAPVHSAHNITTSLNRNYEYLCTYQLLRCIGLWRSLDGSSILPCLSFVYVLRKRYFII